MSKRETRLLALACTFIGIVIGFLIAPIKAGTTVSCGNNNTLGEHSHRKWKRQTRNGRHAPGEDGSGEDSCAF